MGNQASSQCVALESFINEHRDNFLTEIRKIPQPKRHSITEKLHDIRHDYANIVIIAKGSTKSHYIWQLIGFSVLILFETELPFEQNKFVKLKHFESYNFLVVTIDPINAHHIIYFMSKAKIYLGRTELINRILLCKQNCTNEFDLFLHTGGDQIDQTSFMNAPLIQICNPTEEISLTQSDALFTSSSYAAFQTYRRSLSMNFELTETSDMSESAASSFLKPISEPPSIVDDLSSSSSLAASNAALFAEPISMEELDRQRIMRRYASPAQKPQAQRRQCTPKSRTQEASKKPPQPSFVSDSGTESSTGVAKRTPLNLKPRKPSVVVVNFSSDSDSM